MISAVIDMLMNYELLLPTAAFARMVSTATIPPAAACRYRIRSALDFGFWSVCFGLDILDFCLNGNKSPAKYLCHVMISRQSFATCN